jgi:hypothetical protein
VTSSLRKFRRPILAALAFMAFSASASAAFTCQGQISHLGLTPDGSVNVNIGFGTWYICGVSASITSGGIYYDEKACRAWYAAMLAAQKSGTQIVLYFNTPANTQNGPECSAIGHWVAPNPGAYYMASIP